MMEAANTLPELKEATAAAATAAATGARERFDSGSMARFQERAILCVDE
jgi:hypothetical protein